MEHTNSSLAWFPPRCRSEDVVGGSLRLTGRFHEPGFVILDLQNVEPAMEVGGGILEAVLNDTGARAQEGGRHLGDQLFEAVGLFRGHSSERTKLVVKE